MRRTPLRGQAGTVTAQGWALEATGLRRSFGTRLALDGVDLRVAPGEIHGLLGPNGAGKSTLLRLILGLVRADAGSLLLLGRSRAQAGHRILDGVAGWAGTPRFDPRLTARRTLRALACLDGGDAPGRVDGALEAVGLADRAADRVGGWSTGQRQRLAVAAALLRAPRLLILDEPASGLDPAAGRDLRALLTGLAAEGVAVLLSSHLMADVEAVCGRITVLRAGRVAFAGSLDRLRAEAGEAVVRLRTSDDTAAAAVRFPGVSVRRVDGWLALQGGEPARDAFVLALAAQGIAVRALHPEVAPLEAAFLALTAVPG